MGMFDGIEAAKTTGGTGNYLPEGTHIVRVDRCVSGTSLQGQPYCLAELTVLKSSNPKVEVGSAQTWYRGFKFRDSALGDVKAFVLACLAAQGVEMAESEFTAATANEAFGEGQVLRGSIVVAVGFKKETKTTKGIRNLPESERKYYMGYSFRAPTEKDLESVVE